MTALILFFNVLFFSLLFNCSSSIETLSNLNLKQFLLEGKQNEREQILDFNNVCNCQCRENLEVFDNRFNGYKGNCRTKENGFYWCYIPDEAVPFCRHAVQGKYADSYYSLDACYTPAPNTGPCTKQWAKEYDDLDEVVLDMCAIKKGRYDENKDVLQDIIQACYDPNGDGQPHMGCEHKIETIWGPALPCDCINVQFTTGAVQLDRNRYIYCEDGAGVALGGRLVDTSATTGLGSVKVGQTWKARRRCTWRIVPRIGGSWKCVR